jgi:hypothetical protein
MRALILNMATVIHSCICTNVYDVVHIVLQLGPLPPGKNPFAVQINNNNIIKSIM